MEAQKLLDAAPFDPQIVKLLKQAFDGAWESIRDATAPERINDVWVSLAHALIAHATGGWDDRESLTTAALEAFKHPPRVSIWDP